MKVAAITDIGGQLNEYVAAAEAADELVVLTRDGHPVAVLLPVADEDELERIALAHSRPLADVLAAGRQQIRANGGIPHAEFWARVEADHSAEQDH